MRETFAPTQEEREGLNSVRVFNDAMTFARTMREQYGYVAISSNKDDNAAYDVTWYEQPPWLWEYSAYGQYQDFHYSRRRSDDRVERHPNNQPCKCPNAAEYGGTWQR